MIRAILGWETDAHSHGLIAHRELGQFYHLVNGKTGTFERRRAAEGPFGAYAAGATTAST